MSTARLFIASFGFLIIIVGSWHIRAGRSQLSTNALSRSRRAFNQWGILFGLAVFFLGLAVVLLSTIRVDNWSVVDWTFGVCFAVVLYFAGGFLGVLAGTDLQKEEASREAHPPIASNGAQA